MAKKLPFAIKTPQKKLSKIGLSFKSPQSN